MSLNELDKAYEILAQASGDNDPDTNYKIAKNAYDTSNECLEAAIIMAMCLNEVDQKITILLNAKDQNEHLIHKSNYRRLLYEIANLCMDAGFNRLALEHFLLLEKLDVDDDYHCYYHLLNLLALLEDEKIANYIDINTNDLKSLFPYAVYLYKSARFNESIACFKKIVSLNACFYGVLSGAIVEGEDEENADLKLALKILRQNSYLVNSCPGFISYMVKHLDVCYN